MKPHPEMVEGPEALARFEHAMRSLFSNRKADVIPKKAKTHKLGRPKKTEGKQG